MTQFRTLSGTQQKFDGTPAKGKVRVEANVDTIIDSTDKIVFSHSAEERLDADGKFAIPLPCSDDPDLLPQDFAFRVTITMSHGTVETDWFSVPASADPLDISEVTPYTLPGGGTPPPVGGGEVYPATGTTLGIIRLAGDLGGTADLPTVPALALKASVNDARFALAVSASQPGHTHSVANVTGLQAALDGKQASGDYATNAALTAGLAGKAATTHTHDDRYYTESETDTLLAGKQDAGSYATAVHTHTVAAISDFTTAVDARVQNVIGAAPAALDTLAELAASLGNDASFATTMTNALSGKAPNVHTHTAAQVTGLATVATTGAYSDLTGKPTLGTAAATAATDYATAAQGTKADTALQASTAQAINAQTGTSYTLVASDAGKLVTLTNAAAITLTVPGSVFTAGQRIDCLVLGAGMVTVAGTGVQGTPSKTSRAQYSAFTVVVLSPTSFVVVGDLA